MSAPSPLRRLSLGFGRRATRGGEPAQVPRIYAIGDIHGRLDLLRPLVHRIEADNSARESRPTRMVILGDFIDRGPQSAQIIAMLMQLRAAQAVIILKGNHEATMIDALAGDHSALDLWLAHGGAETLLSFGLAPDTIEDGGPALLRAARRAVGPEVRRWLAKLPLSVRYGDYYFVHAGVRPGVALDRQNDEDRLWIGDEFITSDADHGAVIVHGHTIHEDGVMIAANRIGVDTGAYRTGRLSAVGLEDDRVWTLVAEATEHPDANQ